MSASGSNAGAHDASGDLERHVAEVAQPFWK
jgi:hypothetical protein